jgi:hypothetical protein
MPSTPTEALLDVNMVIASVFADHVMHAQARKFVEALGRFHTTPTTQGGFLRFATRPWKNERKEEQPPRLTMADAQSKLREFTAAAGHVFCRTTRRSPNWACVHCRAIGNGPTPTCCISPASMDWRWLRLKAAWPILKTRPRPSCLL